MEDKMEDKIKLFGLKLFESFVFVEGFQILVRVLSILLSSIFLLQPFNWKLEIKRVQHTARSLKTVEQWKM